MRVAVLMSSYNGEKYIETQLESILAQKGDIEIDLWVRDDGSNDKTNEILEEYEKQNRIRYFREENVGPSFSFLKLIKYCGDYDYYAFSDQDDYWLPEKIISAINVLGNQKKQTLYCSNAQLVDSNLNSLGRNVYLQKPKTDIVTLSCAGGLLGCTMVFNRSLAKAVQKNEFPQKIILHDFYIAELCLAINGKIIYDENSYIKYRQHNNNVVGVSTSLISTIKSRIRDITTKSRVSIAEQAEQIIMTYGSEMDSSALMWLDKVSRYNNNFINRVALSLSCRTKYINRNMSIKIRLSILLGNR